MDPTRWPPRYACAHRTSYGRADGPQARCTSSSSGQASSASGDPSGSNACQACCHATRYARSQTRDPRRQAPRR